jgi:hypothetical protein
LACRPNQPSPRGCGRPSRPASRVVRRPSACVGVRSFRSSIAGCQCRQPIPVAVRSFTRGVQPATAEAVRCIAKLDAIQLTGIVLDGAILRLHRSPPTRTLGVRQLGQHDWVAPAGEGPPRHPAGQSPESGCDRLETTPRCGRRNVRLRSVPSAGPRVPMLFTPGRLARVRARSAPKIVQRSKESYDGLARTRAYWGENGSTGLPAFRQRQS